MLYSSYRLGCCVSAHGFGHSARIMAVMEALADLVDFHATVVTTVPEWFFRASYPGPLSYHQLQTDVGLVQRTPLEEDIPATLRELENFYPFRQNYMAKLEVLYSECDLVLCDIAPAGIMAAEKIGIPSVLLENFTWDWIYEGYGSQFTEFRPYIRQLKELYFQADYHIQAIPFCAPSQCDLRVEPIARRLRSNREEVRKKMNLKKTQKVVLISMGGDSGDGPKFQVPEHTGDIVYLVPGKKDTVSSSDHLRILPSDSGLHHPDLVACCDAVIGKIGYSTLAEVYQAGVPFGYLRRPRFRESLPLARFIEEEMAGIEITESDLQSGGLHRVVEKLFSLRRPPSRPSKGARQSAEFLARLLQKNLNRYNST